jgi:hypothetical protein
VPIEVLLQPHQDQVTIPDPRILPDIKNPKFEYSLSRMRGKLKANADKYDTEELRVTYVENRCSGICSRLEPTGQRFINWHHQAIIVEYLDECLISFYDKLISQ